MKINGFQIFIFLIIASCFSKGNESEYYSKKKIIEYADYLFENDEYQMAISEYQRAYYISSNSLEKDKLKINIGKCYNYLGLFDSSIEIYKSIIAKSNNEHLLSKLRYQIGLAYFMQKKYSLSEKYLLENTSTIQEPKLLKKNQLLISAIYIIQYNPENALSLLQISPLNNTQEALQLNEIINELKLNKRKKPMVAGMLSSFVPGSGKIYTKNIGDGIFSFLSVIGACYVTYSAIQDDQTNSVKFIVSSILSGTLYLGNIYGSYWASHLYNNNIQNDLLIKIKECIEI